MTSPLAGVRTLIALGRSNSGDQDLIRNASSHLLHRLAHVFIGLLLIAGAFFAFMSAEAVYAQAKQTTTKLYWFIPDGTRADPTVFNIFQWARDGYLPNLKRMMEQGAYGYSVPTFPSHTPTNFATLFTGAYPVKHGVADGPMHTAGNPLNKVSIGGFSSAAKKVDPIWVTMERRYGKDIVLLSVPGSTPPELETGYTIRGRWGGWGADFPATNFEARQTGKQQVTQGRGARLFFFGPQLTKYTSASTAITPPRAVTSYASALEVAMNQFGVTVYGYVYDSTDNNKVDYDRIAFTLDKKNIVADLHAGEWSNWLPIVLTWMVNDKPIPINTFFKIKIIKLEADGFYRVRLFYNNLNKFMTHPPGISQVLNDGVGPMVDFVDNFPPQLIFYKEDKQTFLEEAQMSLDWHRQAAGFVLDRYHPDILIHDTYTPNQMLTSRWWMGYIDPKSRRYNQVSRAERRLLWDEVKTMYKGLDDILGEMLKRADDKTYVIFSSDHGAVPLDKWVRLNNLFAKKGWLHFAMDPRTGEPIIDWHRTKVIYLKMAHVYIHPDKLAGNWYRASGPDYEKLRREVKQALSELKDQETGIKPVSAVHNWEEVPRYLNLPTDRVGDLVIANQAGYGWQEEISADKVIFDVPKKSGYKQAILADKEQGMWTPFAIVGPSIKQGYKMPAPIRHIDQYPTILHLFGKKLETHIDGRVLHEIIQ